MIDLQAPWAKLKRDADKRVIAALPLVDHCLDVGVVGEAILRAWLHALVAAAGRALSEQDIVRLAVLMALHDIGKLNRGFRARIDPKRPKIGHTAVVAALFHAEGLKHGAAACELDGLFTSWGAGEHFAAAMAHHGRPLDAFHWPVQRDSWERLVEHWLPRADGDPAAAIPELIAALRARWPLAWEPGPALPDAPRFVALFAGLVTLADWLGSDTRRFPVEGPHGPARDVPREQAAQAAARTRGFLPLPTPDKDFQASLGFAPHGFQTEAAADDLGPIALIEAETGSGKTEAALWRWLELRRRGEVDGLYFALPTRSAAVQLQQRIDDTLKRVWCEGGVEAVLAVPGYLRAGDATGQALPDYAVRWDRGEPGDGGDSRWAAEHANRFLAARVAVGTIDQALLGTLPVKHALFRAGVLARSLLVVDEVHASDAYMGALLQRLLTHHVAVGGRALLLSATLGAEARAKLLGGPRVPLEAAEAQPYPALSGSAAPLRPAIAANRAEKRVTIEIAGLIEDASAIAERAVAAARQGAAVLVVRNSVGGAIAVAQAVAALDRDLAFAVKGVPTLHHGRFAPDDRERLDKAVERAFGKGRAAGGQVLVGTQTLEQSLDIDADTLITDLAPMDVLLQRIGRLHRHDRKDRGAFAEARVLLLRPAERDLTPLIGRKGGGSHGLGNVYPDIVQLEATLRLLEEAGTIAIPRDNRRLVERASHPDALRRIAQAQGAAWRTHRANCNAGRFADGFTANQIALDLSQRFTEMSFGIVGEDAATRLGLRDLLVDFDVPLAGPFGKPVHRVKVPGWLLPGLKEGTPAQRIDDRRFRLGERQFRYDQWGLQPDS